MRTVILAIAISLTFPIASFGTVLWSTDFESFEVGSSVRLDEFNGHAVYDGENLDDMDLMCVERQANDKCLMIDTTDAVWFTPLAVEGTDIGGYVTPAPGQKITAMADVKFTSCDGIPSAYEEIAMPNVLTSDTGMDIGAGRGFLGVGLVVIRPGTVLQLDDKLTLSFVETESDFESEGQTNWIVQAGVENELGVVEARTLPLCAANQDERIPLANEDFVNVRICAVNDCSANGLGLEIYLNGIKAAGAGTSIFRPLPTSTNSTGLAGMSVRGCAHVDNILFEGKVEAAIWNVTAKQRYPWNGKVDITYTLTGDVTAGVPPEMAIALSVTASNRVNGATYAAAATALSGDTGTAEGAHHIVWDLNAQGLKIKSDEVVFAIRYVDSPKPCCVIDLSGGANASSYPVSYLADVPSGRWTDEYKTTKLVLRLIEPGTFMMNGLYRVTLTKPFYCGLFEVTQKQYELVTGSNPSFYKGAMRPVEDVSWNTIRGNSSTYDWPDLSAVDSNSFVGRIQSRTGLKFDLPTEAQWEYACRAGTVTDYNDGTNYDGYNSYYPNLNKLGRYSNDRYDDTGGYTYAHTTVGLYEPNAWGFYDMHGNVCEWCLDWYGSLASGETDPEGFSSGAGRVLRGGSWRHSASNCTSSYRTYDDPSYGYDYYGFRLVWTLSNRENERSPAALCASDPVAIDSRVEPVVESVAVSWDASWIGGDTNATVVISDNGTEVKRTTGVGEFTLSSIGRHELTYTTYIDGVAQDEVYSATVYVQWKYVVKDGGTIITETTQRSGTVTIPDEIDDYPVTGIGVEVFANCMGITSVMIPETVKQIEVSAFVGCTNVVGLTAPFAPMGIGSEKLSSVVIPEGVTNIVDSAFYGYGNLTNVIIADSVKRIGNMAFGDCSSLIDVNIPDSVEEIGGHAFVGCYGLTNVTIGVGVTNICDRAFADCLDLKNIVVPDSVESIGAGAFSGCSSLTNMVLPFVGSCRGNESRFGYDGEDLFGWIFGWSSYDGGNEVEQFYDVRQSRTYWVPASLRCVKITDDKEIGVGAFDSCSWLTDIALPDGVMHIRNGAFYGCTALQSISLPTTLKSIDCNLNVHCPNLEWEVRGGYKLYGGWLFGYTDDAEGEIPDADSIYGIANGALEGCTALTNLVFSENAVLKYVGTNAFKGCTELRALTLPPSLEEIGDEAFMGCSYLDNVIVPGSVKRVGARAFKNCTDFTGALIEYGVESLGDEAFYGDWRISEVDIPSSVTNIGVSAFGGDSSIIRVGLRGDVRKVSEIFSNYAILREATVKEGDGAIVDGLFEGCAELADVHFLGNSPELANDGRNIYGGTPETLTTYVATTSTGWDGTKGSHSLPQAWPLAGNRRSIAQWDLPTYLVLFDSNGGTLGVQSTYQYSERKFTLPPEPVQTGYKFAGWWTKPVGGLRVTDDTVFIEGVYRTLYAHWTKGRWVFLDPNGGTVENEFVTYIEQAEYGVLPTPVRTGYAFDGWSYNGKTVLATDELLADEDHVLKADWRKNKYIVTFDANSGDGGGVYELEYDSEIVPPVVVREGYMFLGWSPEVAATVPASNVTYTAQWKLNEYRVSLFVGNGEEGSQLVVTHGAKVGDIALPTRDGYVFGGWYDKPEDGKLVDGDTLIVCDMSLYAKWNSIYTVVFGANGGEGVMPDQPFVYGEEQSLSNIVFKATDRRFAGWASEQDGTVAFVDGEVVSNLTDTANGVVTLYAVWEVWTDDMQTCDDAFGGNGVVSLGMDGNILVTLTNVVSGTIEIPDNVGAVTIDLNGHNMAGNGALGETALPGGPAIRIVKGDGESGGGVAATLLAIVDTSEGEKGQIFGGGESAGIEVAEDAATGVKLDVEEGVGVFNGDGSEQELKPKLVGIGNVTVPKSWKTGQKVTWKATSDTGSVFAHWDGPLVDSLNLTVNERRNPSLVFAVPEGFDTNMVTAVFIPIDDDGLYSLGITQTEFELKEAVSAVWVTDDSLSYVTATASGLPTGLKFDAKKMTITGTPTKSGVYWVQIKAKNASGYQWAENVRVTVSGGGGTEAKEPKLTRTSYYPLTVICANEGGTVSGTGVYAEGKKVSVKATPAKGYVFAGWHETANIEKGTVNSVDGADYRSASLNVTVPETRYVFALFATKEDDADSLKVAVEDVTTEKDGTIALDLGACVASLSLPKLAVSGLPSGVKYDAKTLKLTGKATKPGVYTVTVKATNAAATKATDASTATFRITVPNFECAALPGLKPETDAYGVVRSGVIFDDGLVDCTPADGWTVKAAGLPAGLKFATKETKDAMYGIVPAWTVYGVPTAKAGSYTVTFTASKKGEANQIATITLNVEALPGWVVGTFYGKNVARGLRGTWTCPQQFTVTISANGKISMKTVSPGEGAESRTAQLTECREDGIFAFSFHYASGRKGKDGYSEGDCAGIISPVAYGEDGALLGCLTTQDIGVCDENDSPFESKGVVYQSLYSRKPAVSGLPVFGKDNIRVVPVKSDCSDGEVTLKFGTKGAVTATWSGTKPIATCSSYISPYARDADGTVHAKLWLTFLDKTRMNFHDHPVQTGFEFDLLIPAADKVSASDVDVVSARLTSIIADISNGDDVELVQQ